MTTPEPWSILADIAGYLQVSEAAVLRWIAQRKLPAHRVGGIWRFTISEVDAWVRSGIARYVRRQTAEFGMNLCRLHATRTIAVPAMRLIFDALTKNRITTTEAARYLDPRYEHFQKLTNRLQGLEVAA